MKVYSTHFPTAIAMAVASLSVILRPYLEVPSIYLRSFGWFVLKSRDFTLGNHVPICVWRLFPRGCSLSLKLMYVLLFANNSPRVCKTFVLIIKAYVTLHGYVLCTKRQECAYSLILLKPEPSFGPREICLLNRISLIHFKRGWPRVEVNINSLQNL